MIAEAESGRTAAFLITERAHLFALSRYLMAAIDPERLSDPHRPVIVSVRGSLSSGKKIIPDAGREALLREGIPQFSGRQDFDEYWTGESPLTGKWLCASFINAGWNPAMYQTFYGWDEPVIVEKFLANRVYGGVSFVHNAESVRPRADIDIAIEKHDMRPVSYFPHYLDGETLPLRLAFNAAAQNNSSGWLRYVRVTAKDGMLEAPRFLAAFEALEGSAGEPGTPSVLKERELATISRAAPS